MPCPLPAYSRHDGCYIPRVEYHNIIILLLYSVPFCAVAKRRYAVYRFAAPLAKYYVLSLTDSLDGAHRVMSNKLFSNIRFLKRFNSLNPWHLNTMPVLRIVFVRIWLSGSSWQLNPTDETWSLALLFEARVREMTVFFKLLLMEDYYV